MLEKHSTEICVTHALRKELEDVGADLRVPHGHETVQ